MLRLEQPDAIELSTIHSVATALALAQPVVTKPPFCAPHHTASKVAIVGSGSGIIKELAMRVTADATPQRAGHASPARQARTSQSVRGSGTVPRPRS